MSEQCASAAVAFGLVSLVMCWWFPFGALLGTVGAALGLFAWYAGAGTERALVGTALATCGLGSGLLLAWDYWHQALGL